MTELRAGGVTDVGRVRQINQDSPLLADNLRLWAVADGMGGHRGGEVASEVAVTALRERYAGGDRSLDALLAAAYGANRAIHQAAVEDRELRGMGTTLVAIAQTDDEELAFVNVGDSRIYLFRDGNLEQLTDDHSLVGELLREGTITADEARTHPKRNIVTRALGIDPQVLIDTGTVIPYTGDRYLLCSDGLFNEVDEDKIASVLRRIDPPADAASELVRLANEGGGRDNITVVIVDVVDDGGRAVAASGVVPATASSTDDPAGFAAASPAADVETPPRPTRRERREARRLAGTPRRFTWRVAAFLLIVLGVLGAGAAAIWQSARGTYFVAFDDTGHVAVFRGQPDGVLWIDPELVRTTEFTRDQVRPNLRDELDAGLVLDSKAEALAFPATATTTTTSTSTTSTTTTSTTTTAPLAPAPVTPSSVP